MLVQGKPAVEGSVACATIDSVPRIFPNGPVATGVFVYGLWQRLTPAQKRVLLEAARRHGPKVAAATVAATRARRKP